MNNNGWTTITFKQILTKSPEYGANASAIEFDSEKTLRFIRITDIDSSGNLLKKGKVGISYENGNSYILVDNDILIARTGATVGKSLIFKKEYGRCAFAGYLIRFKVNEEKYKVAFLKQYLQSPSYERWLELMSREGAQPNINAKEYSLLKLPNPPEPEQKKIAEILSTWDTAIEQTKKLKEAKMKRKHALMQRLLTGKKRFASYVKSYERFEGKYFDLSRDWKFVKIGEIAKEVKNKNKSGEDITVLSCTKHHGLVDSLSYFGKQIFSKDLSTYKIVKRGQFAYATNHIEEGSIGYQDLHDKAVISPMYTVFKVNESINHSYLFRLLKTETYRQIFEINTNGSIDRRGALRWKDFANIGIPLPSYEEQKKIADVLNTADKEIELLDKQIKALKKQKRGLMQKLLTGKVRVKIEE